MDFSDNYVFVILGATGDLSRKKIIPALYNLALQGKIKDFAVVGFARTDYSSGDLCDLSRKHVKNIDEQIWSDLRSRYYFVPGDFFNENQMKQLGEEIKKTEFEYNLSGNRLFYLATLPQFFNSIAQNLSKFKLTTENKGWSRVIFEKPFGEDLASAKKMNASVKNVFNEDQIFRIDHYLGKELVQNISILRFTNMIFEPLWNNKFIDHIQIILNEDIGVERRGNFYDKYGALKDVVQNHVLQMLSLIAMEAPVKLTGNYVRDEKVKVLRSIREIKDSDIVLAQYDGYKDIDSVASKSTTETFVALKCYIDNLRWSGVPFYVMAGKMMPKRVASIYIQFKQPPCPFMSGCGIKPNHLEIEIQPNDGFHLHLNAKVPGSTELAKVKMDHCHSCAFVNSPEAYENLLLEIIKGDQSSFIRSDEIEHAWSIVDAIKKKKISLETYAPQKIPLGALKLINNDNREWNQS